MNAIRRTTLLLAAGLLVAACAAPTAKPPAAEAAVTVAKTAGSELSRVTLSQKAADRLGIQTVAVEAQGAGKVIPYAAVLYDAKGATWAYTNPEGLVFIRASITVDQIEGDRAILTGGPDAGTKVVTVGAPELYGAETGVGGGH
jgi:uncharacterized iron-regulated membrane protein